MKLFHPEGEANSSRSRRLPEIGAG